MSIILAVLLSTAFTATAAPNSQYLSATEMAEQILPASAAVYEASWQAWEKRDKDPVNWNPNLQEHYILNKEFRNIVALGPETVPWLAKNDDGGVTTGYAFYVLTRTKVPVIKGMSKREALQIGKDLYDSWWSEAVIRSPSYFAEKRQALDRLLTDLKTVPSATQIREFDQWKQLEALGVIGIPHVIKRMEQETSDGFDTLLLTWWASPLRYTSKGWLVLAYRPEDVAIPDRVPLPPAVGDRAYWLDWWEKNKAEYWWLLTKDELASLRSRTTVNP